MPRFPAITFDPAAYVTSALEQSAQGPPLDPLTLICAVVSHHWTLAQQTSLDLRRLFLRA
jgi:hypothetical protein